MKHFLGTPISRIFLGFSALICIANAMGEGPTTRPAPLWPVSDTENFIISKLSEGIQKGIRAQFEASSPIASERKASRDAHAKQHGCVLAQFKVLEDLDKVDLNYGMFREAGKSYEAVIRFSNGSGNPTQDDRVAGGRGMAIKVMGVSGTKLLEDEKFTQDFQMINFPVFFVKNVADYAEFMKDPRAFATSPAHQEEGKVLGTLASPLANPPVNPLTSTYFSMTARQWGETTSMRPAKFSARPIACSPRAPMASKALKDDTNAFRIAMQDTLSQQEVCFEFGVQRQTNDQDMPVDNPVKLWNESDSAFVAVAKITILANQNFSNAKREEQCEDLAITPWHTLPEHQPLGGIESARKTIYQDTSTLRHQLNQRPKFEPTGFADFQ